jgi:hypothetical protein
MTGSTARVCLKCGTAGAPCCPNNTCEGNGCCIYTYQSGYVSQCTAAAAVCAVTTSGTCSASTPASCGTCGGLSQPCCYSSGAGYYVCTAPNTYCSTQSTAGVCQACGGMGQPCCGANSNVVNTSSTGTCTTGLTCRYVTSAYTCQP